MEHKLEHGRADAGADAGGRRRRDADKAPLAQGGKKLFWHEARETAQRLRERERGD